DGGKNPQGLHVEGIAASLRDAVVIDGQVRGCHVSHSETLPRGGDIAGEAAASLHATGVVVEVGVATAYGTPVEQTLVRHVGQLIKHAVQRFRSAWPSAENPGDAIGKPVGMAGPTAAPAIFRLLALEIPRDDVADRHAGEVVVWDTEGSEEGQLAYQDGVIKAAGRRGSAGR